MSWRTTTTHTDGHRRARRHRAMSALIAATVLVAPSCGDDGPESRAADVAGAVAAATGDAVAAAGSVLQPGATVTFTASEFAFAPTDLVAEPGSYAGVLVNDGSIVHDITFADGTTVVADPGASTEFEFTIPDTGTTFLCSIPGHSDAGMAGVISTPASAAADATEVVAGSGGHGGGPVTADVAADPDAPPIERRDPAMPARGAGQGVTLLPGGAAGGGDLIEVELVVEERLMTVADGYEQMVWTFNGQMPGPVLRTEVGDTVRVHLVNPDTSALSHSVDFHASQVAWNDEMRSIAPGQDLIYEFTTDYAGVWMYHCGTDPVLHHIANGMFGMLVVEPAGGLPPVDEEYFVVQSEWYLGPQGGISSLDKAGQAAPAPDLVMFNGVAKQYLDGPIDIATGADVRLFVLDAGPSVDSSFHVVGTIFHDVWREGVHLQAGNTGNWGSQAVDLSPAQGGIVEFRTAEDGLYPMVTHAFNLPGRGAVGLFRSGDGEP